MNEVYVSIEDSRRLSATVDVLQQADVNMFKERDRVRNRLMATVGRYLAVNEPVMVVMLDRMEYPVGRHHVRIEQACELAPLRRSLV